MFKRLLSNLPFNPSLIGQVTFYARRVQRESSVRRTGFVILALAVFLQAFAVFSPPQSTLARSNNDLIVGGFATKAEAVSNCQQNTRGYKTILATYGIDCASVDGATAVTIKSTDNNKQLYSMGHLAYGKKGETPVDISGVGTVYVRYLWAWDSAGASSYKALKVTSSDHKTYYLLNDCGNLVSIGLPIALKKTTPAPKPTPTPTPTPTTPQKPATPTTQTCKNKSTLPNCATPCEYNSLIAADNSECKPCTAAQTHDDMTACLEYRKTVSNLTQKLSDANGTTARAGDVLRYTLTTTNKGKSTIKAYVVNENVSDVLDYAVITNLSKSTMSDGFVLSWPAADIKAGASMVQTFDVQVKNPVPSTPTSSSDPGHFDLAMTNIYGNTTTVKLPATVIKTTEVATTKLPNTGPGTSLIIVTFLVIVAGYLFARSRLIARELEIVRNDYGMSGGNV